MKLELSKGGRVAILGALVAVAAAVVLPRFVSLPGAAEEETVAMTPAERAALRDAARAIRATEAGAPAGRAAAAVADATPATGGAATAPARAVASARSAAAKASHAADAVNAAAADATPAAAPATGAPAPAAAAASPNRVRVAVKPAAETTLRTLTIDREIFAYNGGGRRDPFKSLMTAGDLRPLLSEVRLTSVAYDRTGGNSVAILRDLGTKEQYRVRTGQRLGRMRVVRILPQSIVFTIEELGYSRQETLALTDSTGVLGK